MFFATTEKFSIRVESLHFPMFSAKCWECKIEKRDGHGKLRNGQGEVRKNMWDSIITLGNSTVPEDNQQEAEHTSLNGLQGYAFQIPQSSIEN